MTDQEFTQKIERIMEELRDVGRQISDLAEMPTDRLREYRDAAMSDVRAAVTDTSESVKKRMKIADEYAHKNPWAVIAGASVVGALIGLCISRNKSKRR